MPIIVLIPRTERRLMQKTIHKIRNKNHARRLTTMLILHRGSRVTDVAERPFVHGALSQLVYPVWCGGLDITAFLP